MKSGLRIALRVVAPVVEKLLVQTLLSRWFSETAPE